MRTAALLVLGLLTMGCTGKDTSSEDAADVGGEDTDEADTGVAWDPRLFDCECTARLENDFAEVGTQSFAACLNSEALLDELGRLEHDCAEAFEDDGFQDVFCNCSCASDGEPC